jgi:RimJ/RimL family protein N-acetyltransferase
VRAEVEPGNAASFGLLERLGFTIVGERAAHVVLLRDAGHGDPPLPAGERRG